jgi:hypothetical protein
MLRLKIEFHNYGESFQGQVEILEFFRVVKVLESYNRSNFTPRTFYRYRICFSPASEVGGGPTVPS